MRLLGMTLGNGWTQPVHSDGLLARGGLDEMPGLYAFSARCRGLLGAVQLARHAWWSVFDGERWMTFEIADDETMQRLRASDGLPAWHRRLAPAHPLEARRAPFMSDRIPDALWFGQRPRLDYIFQSRVVAARFLANAVDHCMRYDVPHSSSRDDSEGARFVSYLLWRSGVRMAIDARHVRARPYLPGFRDASYWQSWAREARTPNDYRPFATCR